MPTIFKQYILPRFHRAGPPIEVRINHLSIQPLKGAMQGVWSATRTYAINDKVWDTATPPVQWMSLQGTNLNHATGENAWWTAALNFDYIQADQSKVAVLDSHCQMLTETLGTLKKHISREEGKLTPDARDITLVDYQKLVGATADGTPINEDLTTTNDPVTGTAYGGLLQRIFSDPTAVYTIFFARVLSASQVASGSYVAGDVKTYSGQGTYNPSASYGGGAIVEYNGDTWTTGSSAGTLTGVTPGATGEDETKWIRAREIYFIGDIKAQNIAYSHIMVYGPGTTNAVQKQTAQCQAESCANRLSSMKIEDLLPTVKLADMLNSGLPNRPFALAGNLIPVPGAQWQNEQRQPSDRASKTDEYLQRYYTDFVVGGGMQVPQLTTAQVTINGDFHLITFAHFVALICQLCNYTFDEAADITTSATVWSDVMGQTNPLGNITTSQINPADYSKTNILQVLAVTYEWLVGSDPRCNLGVAEISSSVTFAWQSVLSEVIKAICIQFGCYTQITYDQTLHKAHFRLIDRRSASGRSLPSKWERGKVSNVTARLVSADHVETHYAGDSDIMACPNVHGGGLDKEIRWRAKKLGQLNQQRLDPLDPIYNSKLGIGGQLPAWQPFGGLHIYLTDATITFDHNSGGANYYTLVSASLDATYLRSAPMGVSWNDAADLVQFDNGTSGQITDVTNRNQIFFGLDAGLTQPSTGANKKVLFGYTTGAHIGRNDSGWMLDYATSDSGGTTVGGDGQLYIKTSARLDGTDVRGNPFVGQQIILPARGVFSIVAVNTVDSWAHSILTLDRPVVAGGTALDGRIGGPSIGSEAWISGAFMYYLPASSPINRYPFRANLSDSAWSAAYPFNTGFVVSPAAGNTNPFYLGPHPTDYETHLAFTVSRFEFGATGSPNDSRGNALWSAAQFYAAEEIGSFTQLTIEFVGVVGDGGTMGEYDLLDHYQDYIGGTYQTLLLVGMEIDELRGTVTGTFLQKNSTYYTMPFSDTLLPVWNKGAGNSSGGAGSGAGGGGGASSTGGGGTVPGGFVRTLPGTSADNIIKGAVGVVDLELQSNGTDSTLNVLATDGTTVLADIAADGRAKFVGVTDTDLAHAVVGGVVCSDPNGKLIRVSLLDGQIVVGSSTGTPGSAVLSTGSGLSTTTGPYMLAVNLDIPVTEVHGGTNQTTYALGDVLYASGANTLAKLTGNITGTKKFLTQTGTGSVSAAPGWGTIVAGDIPDLGASYIKNQTTSQSAASFNITNAVSTVANIASTYTSGTATALTLNATGTNAAPNQGLTFNVSGGSPNWDAVGTSASWKVDNAGNATFNSVSVTTGGWVRTAPTSTTTQVIRPASASGVTPLRLQGRDSALNLQSWEFDTGSAVNTVGVIDHLGNVTFNSLALTVALPVTSGGTGLAILPAHALLLGNGTSTMSNIGAGTSGQVPVSGGASADPLWTSRSMPPVGGGGTIAANTTKFFNPNNSGGSAGAAALTNKYNMLVTRACTVADLYVQLDIPPGITDNVATALFKNGVITALTVVITGGATIIGNNTGTSITCAVGDYLSIQAVSTLTSASTEICWGVDIR